MCRNCGKTVAVPIKGRCAYCGERLDDPDVTSDDHTPYAEAVAAGTRGHRKMRRWVYRANKQRLAHLALLRPSRASRRFARINVFNLSAALALAVFFHSGWHNEKLRTPAALAEAAAPQGKGWWQAIDAASRARETGDLLAVWWNPAWALLSAAATFALAAIVMSVLIAVVSRGAAGALHGAQQGSTRLRCAVQYSTAWLHWLALAAVITALIPLARLADQAGWGRFPIPILQIAAVILALIGLLMWWLWGVRLAQTTQPETRRSVVRFFLLWAPLWSAAIMAGTVYGLWRATDPLARILNLHW